MPKERKLGVGRIVHVHVQEGGELVPNAALVLALGEEGKAFLEVFWVAGFGGQGRGWFDHSPTPMEGRWSWPALL